MKEQSDSDKPWVFKKEVKNLKYPKYKSTIGDVMAEDLIKLHEERLEIENRIYAELNRIADIVNTYTKDGDEIEIIANNSYKLQVVEGDILIIRDTGSVLFKDLKISTEYQMIRLILERREEILRKFIEFNERMIKMGKNISESYLK